MAENPLKTPRKLTQAVRCVRRPNRVAPRVFTAKKIGYLVCAFLNARRELEPGRPPVKGDAGFGRESDLRAAISDCMTLCPDEVEEEQEEQAEQAVNESVITSLISTVEANKTAIGIGLAVLVSLAFVPRMIQLLPAALVSLLPIAARTVGPRISATIIQLRKQEAANDAIIRVVTQLKKAA